MKVNELSPLQRIYLTNVVGEDNLQDPNEEVASIFQRLGTKSRSAKWHLTRLQNPPVIEPKPELKKITVRFNDEDYRLLEQLVQARATVVSRNKDEKTKRVSARLTEAEWSKLEKAVELTGKTQGQVFAELLRSARDNPKLLEGLEFQTKSDLLKGLLMTLNVEGVEPMTVVKLQKLANLTLL